ncbi:MAG TPA: DNA translocase FtsK [Prolixibacteraceae bacterium]|nr:DNA translocase FtsK [Prolixibacteraceae bacterium]
MAEKKKVSATKSKQKTSKVGVKTGNPARKEKTEIIFGFILSAFTIYLLIAFVSFLFNADADQSKLQIKWIDLIKNPDIKVENITGKTGAWLADVFINRWFGLASFLFIYLMVLYSMKLFNQKVRALLTKTIQALVLLLWLSITLGFTFETKYDSASIYPGGMIGYYIAVWLDSMIGKIGTFFVMLLAILIYLTVVVENFVSIFKRKNTGKEKKEKKSSFKQAKEEQEEPETEDEDEGLVEEEEEEEEEERIDNDERVIFESQSKKGKPQKDINELISRDDDEYFNNEEEVYIPPQKKESALSNKKTFVEPEPVLDDSELEVEMDELSDEEYENLPPMGDYDPTLDLSNYHFPPIDLLEDYSHLKSEVSDEELIENKNKIVETLRNFKIEIVKIKATIGPTVTLYEIVPAQGIRISKIKNLEDDIALSLSALGIRIIAPIPGRGTIGIEVPNRQPQVVSMRSIIASKKFQETTAELPVAIGRTISNDIFVFDLTKMPHILVAGATGQGKSVGLNAIITSILYKKHPSEVKFVFIDPKKVELNLYASIEKHFLAKLPNSDEPIITDVEQVKATLMSIGVEMDNRYNLLKIAHARNVKEYNKKFISRKLNPEKGHRYLPYIIVVIDEFADLIMTAGKEIEFPIARIAQLARAIGIHMVIATQRPSTNIITGVIKANFPSRIAFKVASMIDSRTILDHPGANQLIGKGDMLFSAGSELVRLQCALVDTPEVENICEHIASQQCYPTAYLLPECTGDDGEAPGAVDLNQKDEFFDDAARLVVLNQQGSTSMIQRRFSIGYNRAGRIMDQLEAAGIVGPSEGSKARRVLYQDEYSLEQLLNNM